MKFEELQNAIIFRNALDELPGFIANQKTKPLIDSAVTRNNSSTYDPKFRQSNQTSVNPDNPMIRRVRELALIANAEHFNINISIYCKENHFIQYDAGGKFDPHTDTIWPADVRHLNKNPVRKLTGIALLNNEFTGGKLALWYTDKRYSFDFNPGDVIFFPSYVKHQIDPITSGIRYSLVSWSYGEY